MILKHFRILISGEPQEFLRLLRGKTLAHKKRPRRVLVVNQLTLIRRLRRIRFVLKGLEVLPEDPDHQASFRSDP